jgi:hypothetical protein
VTGGCAWRSKASVPPAEAERATRVLQASRPSRRDGGVEGARARRVEGVGEPARFVRGRRRPRAEPIRRERDEALSRQPVAHVAGELPEPLRFVDDQHPGPDARGGLGQIGPSPLCGNGVRELGTDARALHAAPSAWLATLAA